MMLFYRKKRIHRRLSAIADPGFVVNVDRGNHRFFLNFYSVSEFETWQVTLDPEDRTFNEVVTSDLRKLIIDIDGPPCALPMFDFERHIESRIRDVFAALEIGTPDVLMFSMVDAHGEICEDKLSYHAVVSNFSFSARTCMGLCMIISSGQAWDKYVDMGVYKTVQCVRMEGSTKFGETRWKHRVSSADDFAKGLLSQSACKSDFSCALTESRYRQVSVKTEEKTGKSTIIDMSQFRMGKPNVNGTVPLYRTRPGYCCQCERVHDRENAAIMDRGSTFVCWRYAFSRLAA